jgi:hypothetical protein
MANNLLTNTVIALRFEVATESNKIYISAAPNKGTAGELEALQAIALIAGIFRRYSIPFGVYERNVGPKYVNMADCIIISSIPSLENFLGRVEHWEAIGSLAPG